MVGQGGVGGGVGYQREPHGQGGAGQGDGHAAVGRPHHPDDGVQLEARVPILTLNQPLGVLQRLNGLNNGGSNVLTRRSIKSSYFMTD